MTPEEELEDLMRKTKASWQDEFGLRGPASQFRPTQARSLEPVQPFNVKEIDNGIITRGTPLNKRPNLDGTYDNGDSGSVPPGTVVQTVFGAVNGVPATLNVLATGDWTPV